MYSGIVVANLLKSSRIAKIAQLAMCFNKNPLSSMIDFIKVVRLGVWWVSGGAYKKCLHVIK